MGSWSCDTFGSKMFSMRLDDCKFKFFASNHKIKFTGPLKVVITSSHLFVYHIFESENCSEPQCNKIATKFLNDSFALLFKEKSKFNSIEKVFKKPKFDRIVWFNGENKESKHVLQFKNQNEFIEFRSAFCHQQFDASLSSPQHLGSDFGGLRSIPKDKDLQKFLEEFNMVVFDAVENLFLNINTLLENMSQNVSKKRENICNGLMFNGTQTIPLISVQVRASLIHAAARVELIQNYLNKEEQPIEAIYYFPVDPDGSVTNFKAEIDGKVIKGVVKPREEAQKSYTNSVQNKTTFLGEDNKNNIFKLRVGLLKPGAQVKIVVEYITEVKNEPGTNNIRFYIPTTIAPRYIPSSSGTDEQASDIRKLHFSSSSAPLSIRVTVLMQCGFKTIDSPTHKVTVNFSECDNYHKAIVELCGQTTDMDRDFVLAIEPNEKHKPRLYSETNDSNQTTAVMVHLIPSFKLGELKTELIFVLNRSESMDGKKMELAKQALLLFLHSMPSDCYFNVIGFGSRHESLFPTSAKYNDATLTRAKASGKALQANLGGTEILEPLQEIFGQPGIDGYLRQIFVLIDGQVSNTNAVLSIVHANAHKARVFALGIGDAVSHGLVGSIAKAGGGTAAYVTYNETFDKKALNQLKNALQPSLTEIHLEWEGLSSIEKPSAPVLNQTKSDAALTSDLSRWTKQSPERIPPVFDGSQLLVFGLFKNDCPKSLLITAQSPDGPLTVRVEHPTADNLDDDLCLLLHRLAAIKLVRELEATEDWEPREGLKQEIIEIACQNGITSRYTAFVAIDVNDDKQSMMDNWVMETRYVPNQLDRGWHGSHYVNRPPVRISSSLLANLKSDTSGDSVVENASPLMQLVNLQSYDGSFTLDERLSVVLDKSLNEMTAASNHHNLTCDVFATALAISFFANNLADEKEKWDLIVAKAQNWLIENVQPVNVDEIFELVYDFLKSQKK